MLTQKKKKEERRAVLLLLLLRFVREKETRLAGTDMSGAGSPCTIFRSSCLACLVGRVSLSLLRQARSLSLPPFLHPFIRPLSLSALLSIMAPFYSCFALIRPGLFILLPGTPCSPEGWCQPRQRELEGAALPDGRAIDIFFCALCVCVGKVFPYIFISYYIFLKMSFLNMARGMLTSAANLLVSPPRHLIGQQEISKFCCSCRRLRVQRRRRCVSVSTALNN